MLSDLHIKYKSLRAESEGISCGRPGSIWRRTTWKWEAEPARVSRDLWVTDPSLPEPQPLRDGRWLRAPLQKDSFRCSGCQTKMSHKNDDMRRPACRELMFSWWESSITVQNYCANFKRLSLHLHIWNGSHPQGTLWAALSWKTPEWTCFTMQP